MFVAVLAAALVAFAWASLRIVFTPERLKYLLADQMETVLQRPVRMEAVHIHPLGVRVDGLKILRKDKPWAEPLVESEKLVANFQILPLLTQGRLVIDEVWLGSPKIRIIRKADGTWSWQDLFERPPKAGRASPVSLSVAEARIADGEVVFLDELRGTRHAADQIQFRVKDFQDSGPFRVQLSFAAENQGPSRRLSGSMELDARVDLAGYDWTRARAEVTTLKVSAPQGRFTARGELEDFTRPKGEVRLEMSPLDGADLGLDLPGLRLPRLEAVARFEMTATSSVAVRSFRVADRSSSLAGDAELGWGGGVSWKLHLNSPGLDLADASAYWKALAPFEMSGRLKFETTVSSGPAGLSFGRSRASVENGRGVFAWSRMREVNGDYSALPDFRKARLRLNRSSARVFGQELSDLSLDVDIAGSTLTFRRVKGDWNGMHWALRGRVEDFLTPTRIELEGGADVIKIQELVNFAQSVIAYRKSRAAAAPERERKWFEYVKYGLPKVFPALAGQLSAGRLEYDYLTAQNFNVVFDLNGLGYGMKQLNGTAQFEAGPGQLLNIPGMMENSGFLRVLFLPFVTLDKISSMGIMKGWKQQETLRYTRIFGDYKAVWGNVRMDPLLVDTEEILLNAEGQMDLRAESINLYVLNRLYKVKGTLPETLTCDDGKPCIAFFVEGDLGRPDVELDLNKIRTEKGTKTLKKRLEQLKILRKIIPID